MLRKTLKIAVSGTNYTGKSCLCSAITGRAIEKEYSCTIGVDLMTKHINDNISLYFWDLAGVDRFQRIIFSYIRDSSIIIFCYSSESYDSFRKISDRYLRYKKCKQFDDKHIIIVATKSDSTKAIDGFEEWGETFAKNHGFPFVKTSAYTNEGVEELTELCITDDIVSIQTQLPIIKLKTVKHWKLLSCCLF